MMPASPRSIADRATLAVRPSLLVAGLALLYLVDLLLWLLSPGRVLVGVMDETAHVVTAVIVLSQAARTVPLVVFVGVLVGAVVIDLDHIPMELGLDALTADGRRPYTHSLVSVAALGLACLAVPRRWVAFVAGVTLGIACHLLRDLGTAGGVPLLWPLSARSIEVPYLLYAALLALLVTRSVLFDRSLAVVRARP